MNQATIKRMHERARTASAEAYATSILEFTSAYDRVQIEIGRERSREAGLAIEAAERLSERLSEARTPLDRALIRSGKEQKALAEFLGVAQPAISAWASGKDGLPVDRIEAIAEFFEADQDDFLEMAPNSYDDTANRLDASPFGWASVVSDRSDKEIATVCGVSTREVKRWVFGKAYPTEAQFTKFARAFLPGMLEAFGLDG